MTSSHILRTDSGGQRGFGHLRRCLSLADAIVERGKCPTVQLGYSDAESNRFVRDAGYKPCNLAEADWFRLLPEHEAADCVILDVSHGATCAEPNRASEFCRQLRDAGVRSVLIDGIGDSCLSALGTFPVDVLAIPYIGAEGVAVRSGAKTDVRGLDYFVLDPSFRNLDVGRRGITDQPKRVLITAGGSDPCELTLLFIGAVSLIADRTLDVRVVIGPAFSDRLVGRIDLAIARTPHIVEKIQAPPSLAAVGIWADVALSASGLTKYELAYCGTPALLASIDEDHANANIPFAALGACGDLGLAKRLSAADVADAVTQLLDDPARRQYMSNTGRSLIDGQGAERLLDLAENV